MRDTHWQVPWWERYTNKRHNASFSDREKAETFRSGCLDQIAKEDIEQAEMEVKNGASVKLYDIPDYDGTAGWFTRYIATVAQAMGRATSMEDRETIRKDLTALGNATRSIKALVDNSEVEKRVAEVEAVLKKIRTKRKMGAGTRGSVVELKAVEGGGK